MKRRLVQAQPNAVKKEKRSEPQKRSPFLFGNIKATTSQGLYCSWQKLTNALCPVNVAQPISTTTAAISLLRFEEHTEGDLLFAFGLATGFFKLRLLELKFLAKLLHNKIEAFL